MTLRETLRALEARLPSATPEERAQYRATLERIARRGAKPHGSRMGASFEAVVRPAKEA